MPFFEAGGLDPYARTLRCTIASAGDGLVLGAAHWIAAYRQRDAEWYMQPAMRAIAGYFGFGLLMALAVEGLATSLPECGLFAWRYSALMPVVPGTSIALVPLAMWVIVPAATLGVVRLGRT